MPVHARIDGGILRITVDGDYTSDEFRRVGVEALDRMEQRPALVYLDFSGAAGLDRRTPAQLKRTAAVFAERAADLDRVAILAPGDLGYGLMRMASAFGGAHGLRVQAFRTGMEAMAWLENARDGSVASGDG